MPICVLKVGVDLALRDIVTACERDETERHVLDRAFDFAGSLGPTVWLSGSNSLDTETSYSACPYIQPSLEQDANMDHNCLK